MRLCYELTYPGDRATDTERSVAPPTWLHPPSPAQPRLVLLVVREIRITLRGRAETTTPRTEDLGFVGGGVAGLMREGGREGGREGEREILCKVVAEPILRQQKFMYCTHAHASTEKVHYRKWVGPSFTTNTGLTSIWNLVL